jgi:23S rRNA (cytidine1920-2'-O)/16S rRNA (cytidine1409-2'-O)-methyltransferase
VSTQFVSRGGLKLAHALQTFDFDVTGLSCADFGCSTGGFTDCLLQSGASCVIAVDTGYGVLDYRLRTDDRVRVMERTNAVHADPPDEPVELVVIDMGWTTQDRCMPAALRWLKPAGHIITLIKPHYEAKRMGMDDRLVKGILDETTAADVNAHVLEDLPSHGVEVCAHTRSPILGGKGKTSGNIEYIALLSAPAQTE